MGEYRCRWPATAEYSSAVLLQNAGPLVPVTIELHPNDLTERVKRNQPIPTSLSGLALIDTGAQRGGIDPSVIEHLGLEPCGTRTTTGYGGSVPSAPHYDVRYLFPGPLFLTVDAVWQGAAIGLSGNYVPPTYSSKALALIGRDVLQYLSFSYDGATGTFVITTT